MRDINLENDYRATIKSQLRQLKHSVGNGFSTQHLAEVCGVQRTYLSKVLNFGAHFNDDQLFQAMNYLRFTEAEKDYLLLLHQYQRSEHHNRKAVLKMKLDEYRRRKSKADEHLQTKILEKDETDLYFLKYYLSPYVQVAHMLLTIEEFQVNPLKIKTVLDLNQKQYQSIIDKLFELKLIAQKNQKLMAENSQFFISSESELFEPYHLNAKTQALSQLKKINREEKNSCSTVFSCSEESWLQVRSLFVKFMKEVENIVIKDERPTKGAYQLSVDLFPWIASQQQLKVKNE